MDFKNPTNKNQSNKLVQAQYGAYEKEMWNKGKATWDPEEDPTFKNELLEETDSFVFWKKTVW